MGLEEDNRQQHSMIAFNRYDGRGVQEIAIAFHSERWNLQSLPPIVPSQHVVGGESRKLCSFKLFLGEV